jgi:hypothetical protein
MSVLVYAFTDASEPTIDGRGLDGCPLRLLVEDDLAAVVADHGESRLERSAATLLGYERVMERLTASRAVLPARFGTVLAGDADVLALVGERREELTAALEGVRGAVELGTRARWREGGTPKSPGPGGGPGTAYLTGRMALHRRAHDLARRLDPLAGLARDVRRRVDADEDFPVREAYLVDRDRVSSFARAVRDLDEREPDIEMVCTGPWPPYSFARAVDLTSASGGSA